MLPVVWKRAWVLHLLTHRWGLIPVSLTSAGESAVSWSLLSVEVCCQLKSAVSWWILLSADDFCRQLVSLLSASKFCCQVASSSVSCWICFQLVSRLSTGDSTVRRWTWCRLVMYLLSVDESTVLSTVEHSINLWYCYMYRCWTQTINCRDN
jgi:hypothetical protein